MGSSSIPLSYGARREVLAQIASRYQQATGAQKMLLLLGEISRDAMRLSERKVARELETNRTRSFLL
jgi:hypothetical protein